MIRLDRDLTSNFEGSSTREWLVTNGIGGYAMGTVSGTLTRRYHGLLIAALKPPLGRTLLVTRIDEKAIYQGKVYELNTSLHGGGSVSPKGYELIHSFWLDGTIPTWSYALGYTVLKKRIWMQPGENTTYVHYQLEQAETSMVLSFDVLVNSRNHHATTSPAGLGLKSEIRENGVFFKGPEGVETSIIAERSEIDLVNTWCESFLRIEEYRGFDPFDHNLHAATFRINMHPGEDFTFVLSTVTDPYLDWGKSFEERKAHESKVLGPLKPIAPDPVEEQLALAADQFIVQRSTQGNQEGKSILAGYPWFADWGRDTMISLPGLTLATGRPEIARDILETYSKVIDQGMLPNRFTESSNKLEYNTVDATLWFFVAIYTYFTRTGDNHLLESIFPDLQNIIEWQIRGTRYNIKVDGSDGLLYAGNSGVQLTWMDAKVGNWVITPRTGKPVEVNALWYNALRIMAEFSEKLGLQADQYEILSNLAKKSFDRFWHNEANMCYDVIGGPNGPDPTLRPNQIFAVSLPFSPLSKKRQRAVVDVCASQLLTPCGLRSLSPDDENYIGVYGGSPRQRDRSYHQGIVWGWLIGPFVKAHLRVYGDKKAARQFLEPLLDQLMSHGLGSVSEIFDGDPPHSPRGCIAQAWSIAEILSALEATR